MFAKVFSQILDSSLSENYLTRLVFEDFLKLSTNSGIVDMTPECIARRTNVPLDIVRRGIANLEAPDPLSRTPDMDGRRIMRLDGHREWGWRIVNFEKYRQSATKEMLRMSEAERKAEWRKRKGFSERTPSVPKEEEAEAEAEQSRKCPGHVRDIPLFLESETTANEPSELENAKAVLDFLNQHSGSDFRKVESNLTPIRARMKEHGATVDDVKAMIRRQVSLWKGGDMEQYLTPETLFRPSKFSKYFGARNRKAMNTAAERDKP